jgi:hypothetical protein
MDRLAATACTASCNRTWWAVDVFQAKERKVTTIALPDAASNSAVAHFAIDMKALSRFGQPAASREQQATPGCLFGSRTSVGS